MATQTATALRQEFWRDYGHDAEQFPVDPTMIKRDGKIWFTRALLSGKARLKHDGSPVKMIGDIARFGPILEDATMAVWWAHGGDRPGWIPLPSIGALMEWTMDSVCPTPDGRILEPDHPDSWLRILGLV